MKSSYLRASRRVAVARDPNDPGSRCNGRQRCRPLAIRRRHEVVSVGGLGRRNRHRLSIQLVPPQARHNDHRPQSSWQSIYLA